MKFIFFLTFIVSALKGGLWILLGIIIKNHFDTAISLILRKPLPENLISPNNKKAIDLYIYKIGQILIIIGWIIILTAFSSWIVSFSMPGNNFNFNL